MQEIITLDEFTTVVKWYEYTKDFKKISESDIINANLKEYYFLDSNWIQSFKSTFNYGIIKEEIKIFKNSRETPLDESQIFNLYNNNILKKKYSVNIEKRKSIRIIPNDNIIQTNIMIDNYIFKNFYDNFVLANHNIYEEIARKFLIKEKPKYDILIGSSIFIIVLSKKDIELGIFKSPYEYKGLFLIQYEDQNELKKEIDKIKKISIRDYFNKYEINDEFEKIENQIRTNNQGKKIVIINLKKGIRENMKLIEKINKDILDLSKKKGLINFDKKSSRMNSIIQLLTSIKEIKDYLFDKANRNEIESFSQNYIFSSYLIKIFSILYGYEINKDDKNDLSELKTIIEFIDPEIFNKKIVELLLSFLNILNDELNMSKQKYNNQITLESYESPFDIETKSWLTFENYYNNYYQSIIANIFHLIKKRKKVCPKCQTCLFNFQAFPFLEFDLDNVHKYIIINQTEYKGISIKYQNNKELLKQKQEEYLKNRESQEISLENCFEYYLKSDEFEKDGKEYNCPGCGNKLKFNNGNSTIHKSSDYFIFALNRRNNINFVFNKEFKSQNYIENNKKFKSYELMGIIKFAGKKNYERHYYIILKNFGRWIKFNDEKVEYLEEKDLYNNKLNLRILIYKGKK